MALYTFFFNFEEDFTTFQDHMANSLLRSGLLLDEHDYQITASLDGYKLMQRSNCHKRTQGNFITRFIQSAVFNNISRYVENHYKSLFDELLQYCRKQSMLNTNVKRHFERRLTCLKILDLANSLKESTLLQQEIKFLNHFSLTLTQINISMMKTKEAVMNDKMSNLGFQLFEIDCSKGCDIGECLDILKVSVDTFIYNTSEFLAALVLSCKQPFKTDDKVTFHNLNVVLPNFLRSFKTSFEQSERYFENTKYLLTVKDNTSTNKLAVGEDATLKSETLVSHNISEILRHLQISFEIVSRIHKNYCNSLEVSNADFGSARVCLEKSLELISYVDKLTHKQSITINEDNQLLPSAILSKEANRVIVLDNTEDNTQFDEVFSCYTTDNTDLPLTKQYDDLFENYASQKMLITELQEKLDLLTNVKGRKIAPEPGDQTLLIKEGPAKCVPPEVLDNNLKDTSISSVPPVPPPPPVFDIFAESTTSYSFPKSLVTQVKEMANKNKRDEDIFGSDSNESDDDIIK